MEKSANQTVIVMNVNEDNQPVYRLVTYDIGAGDSPSLNYMPINGLKVTSTLAEVWDELSGARRGAMYIYDQEQGEPCGIVTWEIVRKALQRELS